MSKTHQLITLGNLLTPISRPEPVETNKTYQILGAHWYAKGLYVKETCTGSEICAAKVYRVEKGDFVYNRLFAWKGSFAVATKDNHDCFVSNEFPCFSINSEKLNAQYLWYYFSRESAWAEAFGLSTGGTPTSRNRLKEAKFLAMKIPVPPLQEQQRIVNRINKTSQKTNEAILCHKNSRLLIERLRNASARKSLMENTGDCFVPLGDVVSISGGGTPSKSNPAFWDGDIPWVCPIDMKTDYIHDSQLRITENAIQNTSAKMHKPDCVLIVVRGMILARKVPVALLKGPAAINQDIKALYPNDELLPAYLMATFHAMNDDLLQLVGKSSHDTRKLETSKILNFKIPLPSIEKQKQILKKLDALTLLIMNLENIHTNTAHKLDALLPSILDKAFKGVL